MNNTNRELKCGYRSILFFLRSFQLIHGSASSKSGPLGSGSLLAFNKDARARRWNILLFLLTPGCRPGLTIYRSSGAPPTSTSRQSLSCDVHLIRDSH